MIAEPDDTIPVQNADTLHGIATHEEFSIGRYLPITGTDHVTGAELSVVSNHNSGYITIINREEGQLRPTAAISTDFGFIMLATSLLLITMLAVFARKTISSGIGTLSFRRTPLVSSSGTPEVLSWPPVVRNLFTVITISLFAALSLLLSDYPGYKGPSGTMKLTLIIAGAFLAAMMLRHLTSVIIAETTGWKTLFREYMKVVYNTWFADALILFLLNALIMFAPVSNPIPFIISGVVVTAILIIIRLLRLLNIFINRHISILYFILYLCALEILPVLVIIKILGVF